MHTDKPQIKPVYLVITGLAIIIVGALLSSLLVNAYSTVGLALIFGILILISAYVLFCINTIRSKGSRVVKWLLVPVAIVALVLSGWYVYYLYQQNIQDRIYSADDTIPFSAFDLKITGVDKQQIPLNISRDDLILIDCDSLSYGYNHAAGAPYNEHGWNNKRECMKYHEAKQYLDDYDIRMKVEYEVSAKDTVRGNSLSLTVLPDSGREVALNAGSDTGHDQYAFLGLMGVHYNANPASDFGGNLNRGLTRSGYVSADMRRDEQSIDIQIHYGDESRIIRLSR